MDTIVTVYRGPAAGYTSNPITCEVIRRVLDPQESLVLLALRGRAPRDRPRWLLRVSSKGRPSPREYIYLTRWRAEEAARDVTRGAVGRRSL